MTRAAICLALAACVVQQVTVEVATTGAASELELYVVSGVSCDELLAAPESIVDLATVWNYERFAVGAKPSLSVRPPEGAYVVFVSAIAEDQTSFVGHGCAGSVRFARGGTTRIDIRIR